MAAGPFLLLSPLLDAIFTFPLFSRLRRTPNLADCVLICTRLRQIRLLTAELELPPALPCAADTWQRSLLRRIAINSIWQLVTIWARGRPFHLRCRPPRTSHRRHPSRPICFQGCIDRIGCPNVEVPRRLTVPPRQPGRPGWRSVEQLSRRQAVPHGREFQVADTNPLVEEARSLSVTRRPRKTSTTQPNAAWGAVTVLE